MSAADGPVDLVADVGNTRAHLALYAGDRLLAAAAGRHDDPASLEAALDAVLGGSPSPGRAAAVSVNPAGLAGLLERLAPRLSRPPRVLLEDLPCAVPLRVRAPGRVGPDRVANALWAARSYPGQAAVVVDLGTAITFDVVSAAGEFLGGAIAPGLSTGAWALAARTARLPRVELPDAPPIALGRDTLECIQAGLYWGACGLVDRLCERLEAELGAPPRVVATGGDAARVAPGCRRVEAVVPDLTLRGVLLALREAP